MATIVKQERWYEAQDLPSGGYWTFDGYDDADLDYIDDALAAWKAWREYVVKNGLTTDD